MSFCPNEIVIHGYTVRWGESKKNPPSIRLTGLAGDDIP